MRKVTMKSLTAVILASVIGLLLAAGSALAATDTSSILVTATTVDACVVATTPINFGPYDPATVTEAQGTVLVTCSADLPFQIGLGDGDQPVGIEPPVRRLWDPVKLDYLFYALFMDSARLTPWGDGGDAPGGHLLSTGTGVEETYPVYGRIPAGQYATPGVDYEDGVQVTLVW